MKKKPKSSVDEMLKTLSSIHVPIEYLDFFEIVEVRNEPDHYDIILHEKENIIPEALRGKDVVLDGFTNPISILSHSFSLKKIYLVVKRRRWKVRGETQHHSNEYSLHKEGIKLTPHFVAFLKEFDRATTR